MGIRERLAGAIAPDMVTTITEQTAALESQKEQVAIQGEVATTQARQIKVMEAQIYKMRRLRERLAELELWEDDLGWQRLGPGGELDMPESTRQERVRRSRKMYRSDPNALRIIQLYTDYVVGSGLSVKAKGGETDEDAKIIQDVVDVFLEDRKNKKLFSAQGQRGFSNRLLVDGETFPVLFLPAEAKADGIIKVRRVSSLQIMEILTDPEDELTSLWYLREWAEGSTMRKQWYADWDATAAELKKIKDFRGIPKADPKKYRMTQVVFQSLGTRGQGLLFTILDWLSEFKLFLERRATIMAALALFAWHTKTTGTPEEAELLKAQWGTEIDSIRMPPAFAGARLIETEGAATTPVKTDSGAGAAQIDGTMLFQQICVGSGIPPHMLARGEYWRMATATALDWTLERQFQAYQDLLRSWYEAVLMYQLRFSKKAGTRLPEEDTWSLDLDFPLLSREKAKDMLEALSMGSELGVPEDEVLYQALVALRINNPAEIMNALKAGGEEAEAAEESIQESLRGREGDIIESLMHFAKMLRDDVGQS